MEKATVIEAHPDYYDYLHRLVLNNNGTCEFSDGGGQVINGVWKGTWIRNEKNITLTYDTIEEVYSRPKVYNKIDPIMITMELEVVKETTLFFDGYCFSSCNETWKFKKSPCPDFANQSNNLFNMLEGIDEQTTPLIFYKRNNEKICIPSNITTQLARLSNKRVWVLKSENDFSPVIKSIIEGSEDFKMDKSDYNGIRDIEKCGINFFDFKTNVVNNDKVDQIKQLLNGSSKKSERDDLSYLLRRINKFNETVNELNKFRNENDQYN
ncbi:MAG: hypothetical protein Terrestrivirus5_4 [Terrestrivirus sp.]|uniref:Uncharacterized protein n=1 Tax=Terrestrivirus sp. TaxID=2487775 RepID=A0A3G4ZMU6_9VIRU|nr:MAG: hypothetical protein Terrestrivirus5_4 [Terrestrivirus sp.]